MSGPYQWFYLFNGDSWAKTKASDFHTGRYSDLPIQVIFAAEAIASEGGFIEKPSRHGEPPPIPVLHEMKEVFRRTYNGRFIGLTDNPDNPGAATWRLPQPEGYITQGMVKNMERQVGIHNPTPSAVCSELLRRHQKNPDELLAAAVIALQIQQQDLYRYDMAMDADDFLKARAERVYRVEENFGPRFNPNMNEVTFLREAVMQMANSLRAYADVHGAHFEGKFKLGHRYRTLDGHDVTIVQESRGLPGYECVAGDDGIWRYDRPQDYGRCTGSSNDEQGNPDPCNLVVPE